MYSYGSSNTEKDKIDLWDFRYKDEILLFSIREEIYDGIVFGIMADGAVGLSQ